MKLTDSTPGYFNTHTKEFHGEESYMEQCNTEYIEDRIDITWGEAKKLGADACGHEFPMKSKKNDTKAKEEKILTTPFFA